MKNILYVIIVFFAFFAETISQNQNYFYYYKGKKINIVLDKTRSTVISEKENASSTMRKSNDYIFEDEIKNCLTIVFPKELSSEQYSEKLKYLNKEKDVVKANPNFLTITGKRIGLSDYFYVKLHRNEDYNLLVEEAKKKNTIVVEQNKFMPLWYTLKITKKSEGNTLEIANQFYETKLFASSQPDFLSDDRFCSTDPMFNNLWGLKNTSHPNIDINICKAWQISQGENIKVAVLDQGIFKEHIDLASNIYNLSFNTETNLSPSLLFGDHGTHCAGTIAAVRNNTQVVGVAPLSKLMDVSNSLKGTPNSRIKRADGINWAWQNGADIISNSWGSVRYEVIDDAISNALTKGRNGKGCIIVFASGNDYGQVSYPANSNPNILSVGAISSDGRRASFSNYGRELDVVAPGVGILSTVPNNSVSSEDGTSMACPHVAGVAALILSVNPNLTAKQVSDIIEKTAQKVGGYNYQNDPNHPNGTWNYEMGYGLVDAYEAVKTAKQMLVPKPRLEAPDVMPWGFCKKAIFKVENFPLDEKNATIDWKFPRGSRMTKEIAKNEVEIDFGTNYRAEVHAVVNTQDYKNLDLMYVNTNNNYVRSDMLCMQLEKEKDNKYKMNFVLDTLFIKPLTPYQRQKIVNITTNDCRLYQENSNQEYLEITGSNPSVRATITLAPDTCPDEPITFYLNNITNGYSFIHTEESKKLGDKPDDKTDTCATPEEIEGEVFSNGWQGARRYYFDFYKHKHPYDYLDEETKYKTSAPTSRVSTGYFEIVPAKGYITAHQPMKIQATPNGAELFIDSPRYVGYQEWGKAWIRYVPEDCKASKWELWDFSKAGYATNGYFIDRDKGYSPGTYSMYPNPATNTVFFSVRQPQTESRRGVSLFSAQKHALQNEPYQIELFNTAGVRVLHQEGKGTIAEFSVAHLPAGIYIVHFTQNGVTHKEKLIVE